MVLVPRYAWVSQWDNTKSQGQPNISISVAKNYISKLNCWCHIPWWSRLSVIACRFCLLAMMSHLILQSSAMTQCELYTTGWDLICSASPNSGAVSQRATQFAQVCVSLCLCMCVHALLHSYVCTQTCCKALWMSMPCPQGAGGLARHSPALPRREMSILCLRRFWKAVDMTFTPSYVRAPVYCKERAGEWNGSIYKDSLKTIISQIEFAQAFTPKDFIAIFSCLFIYEKKPHKGSWNQSSISAGWTVVMVENQ